MAKRTGPETRDLHIRADHAEMMRQATLAMERVPAPAREIASLTLDVRCARVSDLESRRKRTLFVAQSTKRAVPSPCPGDRSPPRKPRSSPTPDGSPATGGRSLETPPAPRPGC